MATNSSKAHIIITMEGKQAVDVMAALQKQAQTTRAEIDAMEKAGKTSDPSYAKKVQELNSMQRAINANRTAYVDLDKVVKNLSGTTLRELQRAAKEAKKQMQNMSADDPRLTKLMAQYRAIDNQIGRITGQWQRQDGAIRSVMKRLAAYVGIYGVFNMLKSKVTDMVKKNVEFSDSLSDIRKTTKLSEADVNKLSESLNKIDTRNSREQLHLLAYEAGRLGLGKYGAEGVEGFVRAADKLSVAMKGVLGDDAIVQLTKMADVMGLMNTMGVEKSLLAVGSSINELAQNSTAKGTYISDFSRRIAGIGAQAHMSTAEILAFGAASDALGQELEVSATALNKFIVQLQAKHKTVARATGIDEDYLRTLLEQGKTTEAIVMVLERLKDKGGLSGIAPLMGDLGSDGARLTQVFAQLSENVGKVKEMLDISTDAFAAATSVTNEYNIKNENAAAIMEKVANSWDKLMVNSANVGVMKELALEWQDLSYKLQHNELLIMEVSAAFKLLVMAVKALIAMLPYLTVFLSIKGFVLLATTIKGSLIPAFKSFTVTLGHLGAALFKSQAGVNGLRRAWALLNKTLMSNIFIGLATVVLSLIYKFQSMKKELDDVQQSAENLNQSFNDYNRNSNTAIIQANQLFSKLKNTTKGTKEHSMAMKAINEQYKSYLPQLITEASSLADIEKAQKQVNTQLRQSIALKAKNQAIDEIGIQYTNKMADNLSSLRELYRESNAGSVGDIDIQHLVDYATKYYNEGVRNPDQITARIYREMYQTATGPHSSGILSSDNAEFKVRTKQIYDYMRQYTRNYVNMQKAIAAANDRYNNIIGGFLEPAAGTSGPYSIIENEEQKAERARREGLKKAKEEYDAVMSAIEVFYKQQQQIVNKQYIDKEITAEQREQALDSIEMKHLMTRQQARLALMQKENRWTAQVNDLYLEDIAQTEESAQAIRNLLDKNLKAIGDRLRQFGQGEMDGVWKNLEDDRLRIQKIAIDYRKDVEAILLEYDYTGKVDRNFRDALERLQLFFVDYTAAYDKGAKSAMEAMDKAMQGLSNVSQFANGIDINSAEGQEVFRGLLRQQQIFSEEMISLKEEELKVLYYKTLEYADATTEAERKAKERQLKIARERYKQLGREEYWQEDDEKNQRGVNMYSQARDLGIGSDKMVADQEVLMYQRRLEAAMEYYAYLEANGHNTEQAMMDIEEARTALSEKMVEQVKTKLDTLRSYTDSVSEFGSELGATLADEEATMESAVTNMLRKMGEATNQIIMNWVKEKLEHMILRQTMLKREEKYQDDMVDAGKDGSKDSLNEVKRAGRKGLQELGRQVAQRLGIKQQEAELSTEIESQSQDAQNILVNEGQGAITEAVTQFGNEAIAAQATQAAASVGTEAAATSAKVPLGIASGASKTIGELGWWGLPLVGVISAVLGGLLNFAMGKVSSAFGSKNTNNTSTATNAKLVTGMLTYDSGNVAQWRNTVPVLGNDGRWYDATPAGELGTGMVNRPTMTTIGGQPALVGERGPEMVIGRETTAAMMMNRPDLLSAIVNFDQNRRSGMRTYDGGNIDTFATDADGSSSKAMVAEVMKQMKPMLDGVSRALRQSAQTNIELTERMGKGIPVTLARYGRNSIEEIAKEIKKQSNGK